MIATRATCSHPAAETQRPVEIGSANILDQRRRIEGQRALITRLERDGSPDLADSIRVLGQMEQALTQMAAHHAAALSSADPAAEPTTHAVLTIESPAMISPPLSR